MENDVTKNKRYEGTTEARKSILFQYKEVLRSHGVINKCC